MLTRRELLQTTLIALAVPAAAVANAPLSPERHARLIAIGGCPEGDAFCAMNLPGLSRIGTDVGDILQLLVSGADRPEVSAWVGLTRDSDYVLIRHALLGHGLREVYLGDHIASRSGWRHELRADGRTLERIAPAFAAAASGWAGELSACCRWIAQGNGMLAHRALATAPYPRPFNAAQQLKSWAFRP